MCWSLILATADCEAVGSFFLTTVVFVVLAPIAHAMTGGL